MPQHCNFDVQQASNSGFSDGIDKSWQGEGFIIDSLQRTEREHVKGIEKQFICFEGLEAEKAKGTQ